MSAQLSRDPHIRKLQLFRKNFLFLISDGSYPPHRQHRLYQWCQETGVDWDTGRAFVYREAIEFLESVIARVVADKTVTPDELAGLLKLRRRLGLETVYVHALEKLYDLVEQKIKDTILERAAYLSASGLIKTLMEDISAYSLPEKRHDQLVGFLNRQHDLARLMAGKLPNVRPFVELDRDEICHMDVEASFDVSNPTAGRVQGRLVVTDRRVMFLSAEGGVVFRYDNIKAIALLADGITVLGTRDPHAPRGHAVLLMGGTVYCADPQYTATLIGAARRAAITPAPQPLRRNKRLPPLEEGPAS